MKNTRTLIGAALLAGVALSAMMTSRTHAQQFPMIDQLAHHVVQKYQTASCEPLMQEKRAPKPKSPTQAFAGGSRILEQACTSAISVHRPR